MVVKTLIKKGAKKVKRKLDRVSPTMKKIEVEKLKRANKMPSSKREGILKSFYNRYTDKVQRMIEKEADGFSKGGRVDPKRKEAIRKVTGKGGKKRAGPARPLPRPKKPGDFSMPLPRPPRPKPGDRRLQPRPRPKPDRMVLPPRPRKKPKPKLPEGVRKLSPEQRKRLLQLVKKRGTKGSKKRTKPRAK
jgi:hypothetical protein